MDFPSPDDINAFTHLTEASGSREQDSDNDSNWEEKEASRTHSVKFKVDDSEAKEVSYCCAIFPKRYSSIKNPVKTGKLRLILTASKLRCQIRDRAREFGVGFTNRCRNGRAWLRRNVTEKLSRQRAYMAMSSLLVALE